MNFTFIFAEQEEIMKLLIIACFVIICIVAYAQGACIAKDIVETGFFEKVGCTLEKAYEDSVDAIKDGFSYVKNGFKSDEEKLVDDIKSLIPTTTEAAWYQKIFKK